MGSWPVLREQWPCPGGQQSLGMLHQGSVFWPASLKWELVCKTLSMSSRETKECGFCKSWFHRLSEGCSKWWLHVQPHVWLSGCSDLWVLAGVCCWGSWGVRSAALVCSYVQKRCRHGLFCWLWNRSENKAKRTGLVRNLKGKKPCVPSTWKLWPDKQEGWGEWKKKINLDFCKGEPGRQMLYVVVLLHWFRIILLSWSCCSRVCKEALNSS